MSLQAAQEIYDNMAEPVDGRLPISGEVELEESDDYALYVPCKIQFTNGQVTKMWLCSVTTGNWHEFAVEAADCIGESAYYFEEAYETLLEEIELARDDY